MLPRLSQSKLEWRRVAIHCPVRAVDVTIANEDGSHRQRILEACHEGMRVVLRREPANCCDANAISLVVQGDRVIGRLPPDQAAWIAPLVDSGRTIFDGVIWSLRKITDEHNREQIGCELLLTQHDLVPVKRLSLSATFAAARKLLSRSRSAAAPDPVPGAGQLPSSAAISENQSP